MNDQMKLSAGVSAILQDLMDTKVRLMLTLDLLAAREARILELENTLPREPEGEPSP